MAAAGEQGVEAASAGEANDAVETAETEIIPTLQ